MCQHFTMAGNCSVCRRLFVNVQAWNVTTTLFTAFFLVVATIVLLKSCYVPNNDMTTIACASQTNLLFEDSWVLVVLICVVAFVLIVMYQILVAAGVTCDGWCNNKRHTVFLSLLAAISAAVFADFVDHTLRNIPTSAIADPDACYVCPNGQDSGKIALLYIGVIVAFIGFAATVILACSKKNEDTSPQPLKNMLVGDNDA